MIEWLTAAGGAIIYILHKIHKNQITKNLAGDDHIIKCILVVAYVEKSFGKKLKRRQRRGWQKHLLEKKNNMESLKHEEQF